MVTGGVVTAPTRGDDRSDRDLRRVLWILPFVFAIHDGEELMTMPAWIAAHRSELEGLAARSTIAASAIGSLSTTTPSVSVAIGIAAAVVLAVTVAGSRSPGRGWGWHAYLAVLGVLFLHVYTHVLQAVLFGGYVPGLYGAVFAVLPGSAYVYRRLFRAGVLDLKTAARDAALGLVLAIPAVVAAHAAGRLLAPP
jgi:hypothetical protein